MKLENMEFCRKKFLPLCVNQLNLFTGGGCSWCFIVLYCVASLLQEV